MSQFSNVRTILLGAGASVPAGIPTAKGMVNRVYDALKSEQHLWGYFGPAIDTAIGGIQLRRSSMLHDPFSPIDVEELYAVLIELYRREETLLAPFVGSWSRAVVATETRDIHISARHVSEELRRDLMDSVESITRSARNGTTRPYDPRLLSFERALTNALLTANGNNSKANFKAAADAILAKLISFVWIDDKNLVSYLAPLIKTAPTSPLWIASLNYDNAI